MERFTKIAITVWACAAVVLQVWLLHFSWRQLPVLTLAAVAGMAVLVSLDRRSVAILLAAAYVFPVLVRYTRGLQSSFYTVLWLAALLGAMLPDLLRSEWHMPRRWRVPLVFSVVVVASGSLIMIAREIDGLPLLMTDTQSAYWHGLVPPAFTVSWVLHVALTLVIGVLWFDWLFGATAIDFERVIVTPLVLGAFVMALTMVYQVVVDIGFLNESVYRVLGRATGTMYDANVAGMLAALWLGGTYLWAVRLRGWRLYLAAPAMCACAIAVWGSGSRTALVAAAVSVAGISASLLLKDGSIRKRPLIVAAVLFLVLAGGVAASGVADTNGNNPVARFGKMLGTYGSPGALFGELWNRNGYGTVAAYMIRQSPIAGIGVGAFHGLVADTGRAQFGLRLPPDNAQNWLRHEVVELGAVGAAGWLLWFVSFAVFVCMPRRGEPDSIWIARGILVAFGFISLFGVPGQDPMVALTFWVLAFWYAELRGRPAASKPTPTWAWILVGAALAVFATESAVMAWTSLRVPERALRIRQPFSYGYAPIIGAGPDTGYRGVSSRAVAIVEPQPGWLAITVRLTGDDMPASPPDVRVWMNGEAVLKAQLTTPSPFSVYVRIPQMPGSMMLETTVRPQGQPRWWPFMSETGVLMKWEFVDTAPTRFTSPSD